MLNDPTHLTYQSMVWAFTESESG